MRAVPDWMWVPETAEDQRQKWQKARDWVKARMAKALGMVGGIMQKLETAGVSEPTWIYRVRLVTFTWGSVSAY